MAATSDTTSLSWWGNVRRDNYDEVCQRNAEYKEQRLDLFRAVKQVLDAHGICYWIDGGTLLGSFRNGAMIPHDDDTDFGVMEQEQFDRMVAVPAPTRPDFRDGGGLIPGGTSPRFACGYNGEAQVD